MHKLNFLLKLKQYNFELEVLTLKIIQSWDVKLNFQLNLGSSRLEIKA
jgi:hypothetical protein